MRLSALARVVALALAAGLAVQPARGDDPPEAAEEPGASPAPELVLRGFGDVLYRWANDDRGGDSFELGQVDLFVTSRLSDDLSVLGEIVFQPRGGDNFTSHVERLLLTYHPTDALRLSVGRYHTGIGYYNTAFHHGTWFQTAVDRPFLFAFAKDGGILPIHQVGLSASGRLPGADRVGLHYLAEIGHSQPFHTADGRVDPASGEDRLAVNVGLYVRPSAVAGLQVGGSVYLDRVDHPEHPVQDELIAAAHAVYESRQLELLNEVLAIRHSSPGGPATHSYGFYLQAAPKLGRWRPYARYQHFQADAHDPLLAAQGRRHGPSLGLRRELGAFAALKLQYDRTTRRGLGSHDVLSVQAAFTF
jgi:hypothetical protein